MVDAAHRLSPMVGRDPGESCRTATPLELLYDLTFVVAFGVAGDELAHALTQRHIASGVGAFAFAIFATAWAWTSFSWFASAYDTDDWAFRLLTMVQMVGVIILALGLPEMFESIQAGHRLTFGVMVTGYVVMRVSMCGLWFRAWREDPLHRSAAKVYLVTIVVAQACWCALVFSPTSVPVTFALASVPLVIELSGPIVASVRFGGTPWNAHHITERYGLLTIIALGEDVLGTVAVISVLIHDKSVGWSMDTIVVLSAGVLLTFGLWWMYFAIPWASILRGQRDRALPWGYSHILLFGAIVAVGSGLHGAANFVEHDSELGVVGTVLILALPVGIYCLLLLGLYSVFARALDPLHLALIVLTAAVLLLAVLLAAHGVGLPWCLIVVAVAPLVTVVGYETMGYRHVQEHLGRLPSAHELGEPSFQSSSKAMLSKDAIASHTSPSRKVRHQA